MSRKILIIDDEEGVRESLKLILQDQYDLILTESGEQGLEILEKSKDISLIILDIKIAGIWNCSRLIELRLLNYCLRNKHGKYITLFKLDSSARFDGMCYLIFLSGRGVARH